MKLVNIHKLGIVILIMFLSIATAKAQNWTMQQCLDTAQIHNKSLQIKKNNILIASQRQKEINSHLLPKVSLNADYKYFTDLPHQLMPMSVFGGPEGQFKDAQFGVPHNINANLKLSMPLFNAQIYGARKISTIATELTNLQFQKTEEELFFNISNLYYNAQILQNQMSFIDSNLINADKLLKNIKLLNNQLLVNGTDVQKIKLQIAQLNTQKRNVASRFDQVLNALKFSMGISIDRIVKVETQINYQTTQSYPQQATLDYRLVKAKNTLLSTELKSLAHSRLPSLSLFGSYGTTGFGYDEKPNNFIDFYPLGFAGLQLNYPLFDGTVTRKKVNQKKLELRNSELQLELINQKKSLEIKNMELKRTVAVLSINTITDQIQLAQTIYRQTLLQQVQGTSSLSDVLLADNSLITAQSAYINAIIDYLKADLELKKLTGNLK
jgi:outer membrane protein TolC